MKKHLFSKLAAIVLMTLLVGFYNLPTETQKKIIPSVPESITKANIHLGLDLQGGTQLDYKIDLRKVPEDKREDIIEGVKATINRRVNALGVSEPNIYISEIAGEHHIVVELAGIQDIEEAKNTVGKTIQLEFKEEKQDVDPNIKENVRTTAQTVLEKIKSSRENFAIIAEEEEKANPATVNFNNNTEYYYADQLSQDIADKLFALNPGEITNELIEITKEHGEYTIGTSGNLIELTGFAIYKINDKKTAEREVKEPKEVTARHILISYKGAKTSVDENIERTEEEAKALADEILTKLQAAEDFAQLAKQYSNDAGTKENGGLLDQPVKEGDNLYVPEFSEAALKLENTGDLTQPIKTQFGYHIIKAENVKPAITEKRQETQIQFNRLIFLTIPDEWQSTGLTGEHFVQANVEFSPSYQPYVGIEFNEEGAKLFEEITERNINKRLAIFVGGELISAPNVNEKISGGKAQISGNFTVDDASELARDLNTGAIPAPITLTGQQNIGPTLGQQALNTSTKAAIIGLTVLAGFMILYYGIAGILANIALFIYALLVIFFIKSSLPFAVSLAFAITIFIVIVSKILKSTDSGFEKTVSFLLACFVLFFLSFIISTPIVLTLAGIAGIILSIGMAVDANILIFERIKEELKNGHNIKTAIENGFNRAWSSIRDSNFSTLITCAILIYFGTSIIRGFATNLAIGVLVSMFSAITITKTLLLAAADTKLEKSKLFLQLFTIKKRPKTHKIIQKRKIYFGISTLLIVLSLIAIPVFKLNLGMDFTGGTSITVKFNQETNAGEIQNAIAEVKSAIAANNTSEIQTAEDTEAPISDFGAPSVVPAEENTFIIKLKHINNATHELLLSKFQEKFGELEEIKFTTIGPTIGSTLKSKALKALIIALIMIALYIAFAFRKIPKRINPWRFGGAALIALVHDVFITFGVFVVLGKYFGVEIDTLVITALLTILGYSVNDTIVVLDRIRENLKHQKKGESFEEITNISVNQTLTRSINTSLSTLFTITALFLFGAASIKFFVFALIIGITLGTYSSIFLASPILVTWHNYHLNKTK